MDLCWLNLRSKAPELLGIPPGIRLLRQPQPACRLGSAEACIWRDQRRWLACTEHCQLGAEKFLTCPVDVLDSAWEPWRISDDEAKALAAQLPALLENLLCFAMCHAVSQLGLCQTPHCHTRLSPAPHALNSDAKELSEVRKPTFPRGGLFWQFGHLTLEKFALEIFNASKGEPTISNHISSSWQTVFDSVRPFAGPFQWLPLQSNWHELVSRHWHFHQSDGWELVLTNSYPQFRRSKKIQTPHSFLNFIVRSRFRSR